jgi:hypothetical protein
VNDTPYNHYSLLRSNEDLFGLDHLGYAANAGLKPFGDDVFNNPAGTTKFNPPKSGGGAGPAPKITLRGVPTRCVSKGFTARIGIGSNQLRKVEVRRDGRLIASRRVKRFNLRVGIHELESGKHRLSVRAVDTSNRSKTKSASFRVCEDG